MEIRGRFTVRKLFPDFYIKNQMVLSVVSVVVSESLSVPEPVSVVLSVPEPVSVVLSVPEPVSVVLSVPEPVSVVLSESELLSSSVPVSTELLLSVS